MRHPLTPALMLSIALCASDLCADPPSWLDRALVSDLVRRAARRAHLDDDDTASLTARARAAAWVPRISTRVARGFTASSTQYLLPESDRVGTNDSLAFDVQLTFSLDHAVFAPQELDIVRLRAQQAAQRRALEGELLDLLARLEGIRRASPLPGDDPRVVQRLRLLAELEQLTGVTLTP